MMLPTTIKSMIVSSMRLFELPNNENTMYTLGKDIFIYTNHKPIQFVQSQIKVESVHQLKRMTCIQ